jgi:hypothetical protein
MDTQQAILDAVSTLDPEKQEAVLVYAKQLNDKPSTEKPPMMNVYGLWAHLNTNTAAEDIDEVRKEMWKNFPRDDF